MRGLGERQKKESAYTRYRIINALYAEPFTYEQLQRQTKIHTNTLTHRLHELLNERIIMKHKYSFPHRKYNDHNFYLLRWAKKESRDIISFIFENYRANDSVSPYDINSLQIDSHIEKIQSIEYHWISDKEFIKRVTELSLKERKVVIQLFKHYRTQNQLNEERNKLVEARDKILETLIIECTKFCANRYLSLSVSSISAFDMLIFFKIISLYYAWLPYVKIWEVMRCIGW
jgi:hypothetical protein